MKIFQKNKKKKLFNKSKRCNRIYLVKKSNVHSNIDELINLMTYIHPLFIGFINKLLFISIIYTSSKKIILFHIMIKRIS